MMLTDKLIKCRVETDKNGQLMTIQLSAYVKSVLAKHTLFRIHSIFNHGFNIVTPDGLLIYCTNQNIGHHVLVMQFNIENFDVLKSRLHVNDFVKMSQNKVIFYTSPILKYDAIRNISYDSHFEVTIDEMQLLLFKRQYDLLLKQLELMIMKKSGFSTLKSIELNNIHYPEKKRLNFGDLRQLIGLGIGLTPSGDDFIVGYLIAEKILKRSSVNEILNQLILDDSISNITLSSLRAINDHQLDEPWQNMINSISRCDGEQFVHWINEALKKGATSGADQVLGFLHCIVYSEEKYG